MLCERIAEFVRALAVIVLSVPTISGCSFIFVRGPQTTDAVPLSKRPDCTTSQVAPVVDSVIATAFVLGAASGGKYGTFVRINGEGASDVSTLVDLTSAATFAASAFYGYATVSSCSARAAQFKDEQEQRERPKSARQPEQVKPATSDSPSSKRPDPPAQAAGFAFGWKAQEAGDACTGANGQWNATATKRSCSKTVAGVGFDGEVGLEFWHGRIKRVRVTRNVADDEANSLLVAFTRAKDLLTTEYGKPDQIKEYIPPICHEALAACLRNHRVFVSARWLWPNSFEIAANLSATDTDVVLTLDHFALASVEPVRPRSVDPSSQPPAAEQADAQATMVISSLSGSTVVVDGKPLGATPAHWRGPAGTHEILVVHPQYGKKQVNVESTPGQARDITVSFP
jgi:hypothetical protein